jgi:H+-transporting ATPase
MPEPIIIGGDEAKHSSPADLFTKLASSPQGLSAPEAEARLAQYGPNALEEKKTHPLRQFLSYFWGPIPGMIEVAAILSALVQHWGDLIIIVFLLVFNAVIGFWEEHEAANALDALKSQLALKARVLRDGSWLEIAAQDLVPGDVIRVRPGDIIPADLKLVEGEYLSVDQAALTGESLPVNKAAGDIAYSGSIATQGEMVALVTSTGGNTFFARTAKLVGDRGRGLPLPEGRDARRGGLPDRHRRGTEPHPDRGGAVPGPASHGPGGICLDPRGGLYPGGYARSAFRNHGPGSPGAFQNEGHRLPPTSH